MCHTKFTEYSLFTNGVTISRSFCKMYASQILSLLLLLLSDVCLMGIRPIKEFE